MHMHRAGSAVPEKRTDSVGRAGRNVVFLYFGEFQLNLKPSSNEIIILRTKIKIPVLVRKPFLTEKNTLSGECCRSDKYPFAAKTAKKDVKLERGKIAPLILQISTTPARNKSNEKHCVRVMEAKQTYLRKLFKCNMTETCYTHK